MNSSSFKAFKTKLVKQVYKLGQIQTESGAVAKTSPPVEWGSVKVVVMEAAGDAGEKNTAT